ncbi:signal peptide peptidase SppA [Novosphingobium sp. FSY-8]|uniref:Signal peptide peptidase SppA n=1 Tax=Novosphingobium ovatum TaxID=1908523 RepID=A0ABW9X9J5_9SPHN|nr:signal peptide peptidase SppA [Novosphingobium ovatum]NBC35208.1 signal peptide peptidase SppA [Novosphingobium ovatum]
MDFARKVWRWLVAIKDGLVLLAMLLFFGALYGVLTMRPAEPRVREGALLIRMDGVVVEEPHDTDPLAALKSGDNPKEIAQRDLLRAIRGAATDAKVKALVLDLSKFEGGGLVHMTEIGAAMDSFRATKKPILLFGTMMGDDGIQLAAHATQAWVDPLGGAVLQGPGGMRLYYAGLLDRLKVNAHIYRVGTYKDAIEPFLRDGMSDPSREARKALYDATFGQWRADVATARPRANIDMVVRDPVGWFKASGGDAAKAALAAGLIDRIGTRAEFGAHVASIVGGGDDAKQRPGSFAHTSLAAWLKANPEKTPGRAIGVVTIAGGIVDGSEGPGEAGGARIARLIDRAADKDLAALVVRVDSPGGSVNGSEAIRVAIERHKKKGLPIIVSMGNVAASGGYWVSTPATRIFAQPGTVTGSIGIFAVIPSFERVLAAYGVKGDGVRSTALSGQPDVLTGLSPEVEGMLQANIESGYGRFLGLVAAARHKTPQEIDAIAQGRVWDGLTAQRIGLVDEIGGLDAALNAAAKAARLKDGEWHALYLGENAGGLSGLFKRLGGDEDEDAGEDGADARISGDWAGAIAYQQQQSLARVARDVQSLFAVQGAQATCLDCAGYADLAPRAGAVDGALPGWWARMWLMLAGGQGAAAAPSIR